LRGMASLAILRATTNRSPARSWSIFAATKRASASVRSAPCFGSAMGALAVSSNPPSVILQLFPPLRKRNAQLFAPGRRFALAEISTPNRNDPHTIVKRFSDSQ
jgi:hypothetical protein